MLKLLICVLATVQGAASVGTATYRCNADGTVDFKYAFDPASTPSAANDPLQHIYIVGQGTDSNCFISAVTADHTAGSVELTGVQSNFGAATAECGIVNSGASNNLLTGSFLVAQEVNVVQGGDVLYTYTCDFSNPTTTDTVAAGSTVDASGGAPTGGTATAVAETVSLDVVDANDVTTAVTSCSLGDTNKYKLRLYLLLSSTAEGLYPPTCTAKPTSGSSTTLQLVGNGIATTSDTSCSQKKVGMAGDLGFKKDAQSSGGNYYSVMEDGFDCFRFDGTDTTLYVECTLSFCSTADAACDGAVSADTCSAADPSGRRKRSFGNDTKIERQRKIGVTIVVQPFGGSKTGSKHSADESDTCTGFLHQSTFIVIVCILAVLLALSMGVTIYVVKRTRDGHSNPPPYQSKGIANPSF